MKIKNLSIVLAFLSCALTTTLATPIPNNDLNLSALDNIEDSGNESNNETNKYETGSAYINTGKSNEISIEAFEDFGVGDSFLITEDLNEVPTQVPLNNGNEEHDFSTEGVDSPIVNTEEPTETPFEEFWSPFNNGNNEDIDNEESIIPTQAEKLIEQQNETSDIEGKKKKLKMKKIKRVKASITPKVSIEKTEGSSTPSTDTKSENNVSSTETKTENNESKINESEEKEKENENEKEENENENENEDKTTFDNEVETDAPDNSDNEVETDAPDNSDNEEEKTNENENENENEPDQKLKNAEDSDDAEASD
ncbi:hypothetical protein H8356DRAFT_1435513 [Neocallimastix lanati (nom. inval.)]|nr:hypothetical protein H8356DRAFT_1435513 [Neocallimastix sp. JGI-2020a]